MLFPAAGLAGILLSALLVYPTRAGEYFTGSENAAVFNGRIHRKLKTPLIEPRVIGATYCSDGRQLALALADQSIRYIQIVGDITMYDADWTSTTADNSPVVIGRNVTIEGDTPAREGRRILDMNFVKSKVILQPRVTLECVHLVIDRWREGSHFAAPGIDPVATGPTNLSISDMPTLKFVNVSWIQRTCLPYDFQLRSISALQRRLYSGNQTVAVNISQEGCTPDATSQPTRRCWPMVGVYVDIATAGKNFDSYGRVVDAGYILYLLTTEYICKTVMEDTCVARYQLIGCFNVMFPSNTSVSSSNFSHQLPSNASSVNDTGAAPTSAATPNNKATGGSVDDSDSRRPSGRHRGELLAGVLGGVLGGAALLAITTGAVLRCRASLGRRQQRQLAAVSPRPTSCSGDDKEAISKRSHLWDIGRAGSPKSLAAKRPDNGSERLGAAVASISAPDESGLAVLALELGAASPGECDADDQGLLLCDDDGRDMGGCIADSTRRGPDAGPAGNARDSSSAGGDTPQPRPKVHLDSAVNVSLDASMTSEGARGWSRKPGEDPSLALVTPATRLHPGINLDICIGGGELQLSGVTLGKGAFGRVVRGTYRGVPVAVKLIDHGLGPSQHTAAKQAAPAANGAAACQPQGGQAAVPLAAAAAPAAAAVERSGAAAAAAANTLAVVAAAATAAAAALPAAMLAEALCLQPAVCDSGARWVDAQRETEGTIPGLVQTAYYDSAGSDTQSGAFQRLIVGFMAAGAGAKPPLWAAGGTIASAAGVVDANTIASAGGNGGGQQARPTGGLITTDQAYTATTGGGGSPEGDGRENGAVPSARTGQATLSHANDNAPAAAQQLQPGGSLDNITSEDAVSGGGCAANDPTDGVSLWTSEATATLPSTPPAAANRLAGARLVAEVPGGHTTTSQLASNSMEGAMRQEVEILARCDHPNVIRLLAACLRPPQCCLVMELMETSLERMLYGGGGVLRNGLMPLDTVLRIAVQIAHGLAYLHPTVVHRDLKPGNVLISHTAEESRSRMIVKLADFGLSRLRDTVLITRHPEVGTAAYIAPEAFDIKNHYITDRADVYALGVMLWEMLAGRRPWGGHNMVAIAMAVAMHGLRPPLAPLSAERCPPKLRSLILSCWEQDPARRPAAADVAKTLLLIQQQRDGGSSRWLAEAGARAPRTRAGSSAFDE